MKLVNMCLMLIEGQCHRLEKSHTISIKALHKIEFQPGFSTENSGYENDECLLRYSALVRNG